MKILITGAEGFIGKNLVAQLENIRSGKAKNYNLDRDLELFLFDRNDTIEKLEEYTKNCNFVFHLAGINRPKETSEFMKGNFGFTEILLNSLKKYKNKSPILITSSIQAELDNPYGVSKKAGEELLFNFSKENGNKALVYRLPNVFGKWCKPNYNSAIATFCHNIANDLEIKINDENVNLNLVYIDDVIDEFILALQEKEHAENNYCFIPVTHKVRLGEIAELLYGFRKSRENLMVPNVKEGSFSKKLYSTYLSYLPTDKFSYLLKMNKDERGSFTEILRTELNGQFSVNISKPKITKGNHWHNTKNEKFLVVSGKGLIQFRKIGGTEIKEYYVSGDKLEVVDIPIGYTHNIINLSEIDDLITFMWCNECFDPSRPDTYFDEV